MAYNVSNNWNSKVIGGDKKYASYLTINNTYIPMRQISKIEFIEEVIDKEKEYFNLGTFNSNQMDITFKSLSGLEIASNLPVYCEIGLNTDYQAIDFTYIGLDQNGNKQFQISNAEDLQYFKTHYYVNISVNNVKYERIEILDITNNTFTLDAYQISEIETSDTIVIYPFEYVPKGIFLIDEPEENYYKTCKITCLDYGIKFKTPVDYSVAFVDGKITLKNLLIWLCNHYNVTLGTYPNVNNNIEIGVYDNTLSGKAYVSYIAEMFGGNVKIDRNGVLNIIPLKQIPSKTINALKTKKIELGERFKISKVVYQDAIRNFTSGDDTANTLYIRTENMFVANQTSITNIYNAVKDFEIYSLSNELRSDVSIDCWDIVNYQVNENTYPTYYNNTTTYNMSLMTKVETKIPSKQQEQTTNVVGGTEEAKLSIVKTTLDLVKKQIELLVENIGDDGQVTAATIILAINEDTSSIKLDADKIDLTANDIINLIANNTINLSTKNIVIASNNFNVDANGNCIANSFSSNNATITGGSIILYANGANDNRLKIIDSQNSNCYLQYSARALRWYGISNGYIGLDNILDAPALILTNRNDNKTSTVSSNYIETPKITAGNIASGTCTLNSSNEVYVSFGKTMPSVPSVVITPYTTASGVVAPKVRGIDQYGFNAIIGGSVSGNIDCCWIAISN